MTIPFVTARRVIKAVGNGITKPYFVNCSDGYTYVVKFAQNPEGERVLVNELVCGQLGVLVGLPVPPIAIVVVDDEFLRANSEKIGFGIKKGFHFGSREVKRAITLTNRRILELASNTDIAPLLVLFDHWIHNKDRDSNNGNIMFDTSNKKLVVIDHSHAFDIGPLWNAHQLKMRLHEPIAPLDLRGPVYAKLVPFISGNNPFGKAIQQIESVSVDDIASVLGIIPDEWNCSEGEKDVLFQYLQYRHKLMKNVPDLLRTYLPYWRGGGPL
ncbi:MAG: hypothetical protein K6T83_16585 [Alicyclobacillus sp.]|nr:hypothetical protein [Alicyclobacillus sp.]